MSYSYDQGRMGNCKVTGILERKAKKRKKGYICFYTIIISGTEKKEE